MLELKSFWLRIPSSCKVGWVFLCAYCVCKQKAAVLLGHRAMLETPSALSIKTETSGKQTWLSRGLGWCLLFLTKLSRNFQLRNLKTSTSMTVLPAMRHILGSLPADVLYGQRWSSQVGEGTVTPGKLGMTRSCISKAYTGQWRLKSCLLDLSACFCITQVKLHNTIPLPLGKPCLFSNPRVVYSVAPLSGSLESCGKNEQRPTEVWLSGLEVAKGIRTPRRCNWGWRQASGLVLSVEEMREIY